MNVLGKKHFFLAICKLIAQDNIKFHFLFFCCSLCLQYSSYVCWLIVFIPTSFVIRPVTLPTLCTLLRNVVFLSIYLWIRHITRFKVYPIFFNSRGCSLLVSEVVEYLCRQLLYLFCTGVWEMSVSPPHGVGDSVYILVDSLLLQSFHPLSSLSVRLS